MSGSVNKVFLLGHLGRDPEVRIMTSGDKVVNLSVATSERWRDKSTGEQREKTEWHRVVIFNERLADVAEKYLRKGSPVWIEGQLQTRKWAGNDGQDRYSTEVVLQRFRGEMTLLGKKDENGDAAPSSGGGGGGGGAPFEDDDDEIPFATNVEFCTMPREKICLGG